MTVKELRDILDTLPSDMHVMESAHSDFIELAPTAVQVTEVMNHGDYFQELPRPLIQMTLADRRTWRVRADKVFKALRIGSTA